MSSGFVLLSALMDWAEREFIYQMERSGGCAENLVLASENLRAGILWFQFPPAALRWVSHVSQQMKMSLLPLLPHLCRSVGIQPGSPPVCSQC